MKHYLLRTIGLGALGACLSVAEERALRDEAIGRATAERTSLSVRDGLATVQSLSRDRARLFAEAPELVVEIERGASSSDFCITIANVLRDAELFAEGSAAPVAPLAATAPTPPTVKTWCLPLSGSMRLFLRPPDAGQISPFRFAMFADVQDAIDRVQDIYRLMNDDPAIRFVVIAGDLTARGSRAELERFQRELETLRFPAYATLGNHELGDPDVPFHDVFGRGSFRFRFRGVQVTFLDSASATIEPRVYDWLDTWLLEGRGLAHVVLMHIAPFDPEGTRAGSFASKNEAMKLLSRLAAGGVDLTLYGHVHSYYAFSNAGIPAFIAGGGGAIPERMTGIGRHYLTVDVDPTIQRFTTTLVRVDEP